MARRPDGAGLYFVSIPRNHSVLVQGGPARLLPSVPAAGGISGPGRLGCLGVRQDWRRPGRLPAIDASSPGNKNPALRRGQIPLGSSSGRWSGSIIVICPRSFPSPVPPFRAAGYLGCRVSLPCCGYVMTRIVQSPASPCLKIGETTCVPSRMSFFIINSLCRSRRLAPGR